MAGLIFRTLAELAAFGVGAYSLGSLVLRRIGGNAPLRLLVGLGAAGYAALLLALAHVLRWWALALAGAFVVALARRELSRLRVPRGDRVTVALSLLAGAMACGQFLAALAPPEAYDELAYHLPLAEGLRSDPVRQLFHAPGPYASFPGLGEAITAAGLAVDGPALAHALHLAVLLAFVALATTVVRDLAGPRAGAAAAVALLAYPHLTYIGTTAYVDATCTAFELGAVLLVLRRQVPAAAVLLGLALSVKYTALFTAALLAIPVARLGARRALAAAGIVVAICGFWYAKNLVRYGNPFWPFYFGHRGLDRNTYDDFVAGVRAFGPRTLGAFVEVPWRLASDESLVAFLGLSLVAVALFARPARALAVYALAYVTYWFWLATHQVRFLLTGASAAILAVVVAAASGGRALRLASVAAAVVAVGVAQARVHPFSLGGVGDAVASRFGSPKAQYALGLESRQEYLRRWRGCTADAVAYVDAHPQLSPVLVPQTALAPEFATTARFGKLPLAASSPSAALRAARSFRSVFLLEGEAQNVATTEAASRALLRRTSPVWREPPCRILRLPR